MAIAVKKLFFSEFFVWVVLAIIGCYFLFPLKDSLRFGSDLVGGVYLTLEVQTEKAVVADLANKMRSMTSDLKKAGKPLPTSRNIKDQSIVMTFQSMQDAQEASRLFKGGYPQLQQKTEGTQLTMELTEQMTGRIKADAVQRNVEVLRTRLDQFSVAEIPIKIQGENHIVVELPNVQDPQKAKELIGTAANLGFHLVYRVGSSRQELLYQEDGELPDDKMILAGDANSSSRQYFYLVQRYPDLTGGMLKDAHPALGGKTGIDPVVEFVFDDEGANQFYELTSKNLGKMVAIVLDGEVISAPEIQAAIRERGYISGNFTSDSAKTLSLLLKSGSFVAPVTFEEERQIGPALGEESKQKGLLSCLLGLVLLFFFGLYFYRLSGLFACIVLLYNILFILLVLSKLKATLTLPGIAGMVLTIGMAIDASILIFERIREELATGVSIPKAVDAGFSNAMTVILDGNITTFIIGLVLYHFGAGPIQGFAVTMMVGIVATLVTGLFFLKSMFKCMLDVFDIKKLSI